MKLALILSSLCASLIAAPTDIPIHCDTDKAVIAQITKFEADWNDAVESQSRAKIDGLLSADFLYISEDGTAVSRSDYIDKAVAEQIFSSYHFKDLKIRVYGDTAVAAGIWMGKTSDSGDDEVSLRFTDTMTKKNGRWWAVVSTAHSLSPSTAR